jgi:hypothetical protein
MHCSALVVLRMKSREVCPILPGEGPYQKNFKLVQACFLEESSDFREF